MSLRARKALQIVGVRNDERMMRALAALLKAQADSDGNVSFPEFYGRFREEERVAEIPRPVAYGLLANLEREGYIKVDRSGYRHRYRADTTTVAKGMQRQLRRASAKRAKMSNELDAELLKLRERRDDIGRYSTMIIASMTRGRAGSDIQFATNVSDVRELVQSRILSRARREDTVRVHYGEIEQELLIHSGANLASLLGNGCRVRLLLHATASEGARTSVRELLGNNTEYSGNRILDVRVRARTDLTYEFIGLNEMGIVLAVATTPPMATYIPRHADERLVTHVIATFDREFEQAIGLSEYSTRECQP